MTDGAIAAYIRGQVGTKLGDGDDSFILIHTRIASHLRPDHVDSLLTSAALLEKMGQHDLAVEAYAQIKADNPASYIAEIGRANALYESGQKEVALEVLRSRFDDLMVAIRNVAEISPRVRAEFCADAEDWQDCDREHDDSHATEPLDLLAVIKNRLRQVRFQRLFQHVLAFLAPELEIFRQ